MLIFISIASTQKIYVINSAVMDVSAEPKIQSNWIDWFNGRLKNKLLTLKPILTILMNFLAFQVYSNLLLSNKLCSAKSCEASINYALSTTSVQAYINLLEILIKHERTLMILLTPSHQRNNYFVSIHKCHFIYVRIFECTF